MMWRWIILLVVTSSAVGVLSACAPRVAAPPVEEPGQALFDKAERQFADGSYDNAVELYNDYLALYPDGRHVPAALLKSADFLAARNAHVEARKLYRRLIERFPDTRWAEDAHIGMMLAWYNEKQYEKVLAYADTIDLRMVTGDRRASKYTIAADTYLAMGEPVDAAYVIISALRILDEGQHEKLMPGLNRVAEMVDIDTIQALLADIQNIDARGRAVCRIGKRFIEKGNLEWAELLLSDFVQRFPDNRHVPEAGDLLTVIETESVYDRYAIGCLLPLSGRFSVFGNRALRGIQAAFQTFVSGYVEDGSDIPFRLVIRDSGSDGQKAVQAVRELAGQKVAAIIGPLVSSREAVVEAQKRRIPIITLTQDETVPLIGDYVFRNFLTPQMQVNSLVAYACEERGWRRLAVLYPDEPYGREFAHAFWSGILLHNAEMVAFESYNPQHTDFADPIRRLVGLYYDVPEDIREARKRHIAALGLGPDIAETESGEDGTEPSILETWLTDQETGAAEDTPGGEADEVPAEAEIEKEDEEPRAIVDFDALFIPDGPSKAGLIIPQLIFYDVEGTVFLGTNLWHSRDLIDIAGRYARGAIMPAAFWAEDPNEQVRQFVAGFEKTFGEKPDFIAAVAYDTANILFLVMSDPEVRYRSAIRNRLKELTDYPGVTGTTGFEETGEVDKGLPLLEIRGRTFERIFTPAEGFRTLDSRSRTFN